MIYSIYEPVAYYINRKTSSAKMALEVSYIFLGIVI